MTAAHTATKGQGWSDVAECYKTKINNITNTPARQAVEMASRLRQIDETCHVVDVGSGAGVVTQLVAETTSARITAVDSAQKMLDIIQIPEATRLQKKLLDVNRLSQAFPASTFSHAFCTFMLHLVADEMNVVQEIRKVLQPNGVVAIAVWGLRMDSNATWVRACRTIDPEYELPAALRPTWSWRTSEVLREKIELANFEDIHVTDEMLMPFGFQSASDWTRFTFESKSPVEELKLKTWAHDLGAVRDALLRVTKEDFDDAKVLMASAVIAVARRKE